MPKNRVLIALICFAAAARVFIFSAAFPFFSNGDEDLHFDVITRYASANPPRTFDVLSPASLRLVSIYCSPEFLQSADQFPDGKFPTPLWKLPPAESEPVIAATAEAWKTQVNWELSQPPMYYVVAAIWWKIGSAIGVSGLGTLYWLRFLNVGIAALLSWSGYRAARTVAPTNSNLLIGVPLLLAFMPQDVFYVMGNDALAAVTAGAAFICVLRWLKAERVSVWLAVATGLTIAASYLTKLTTLPLIAFMVLALGAKTVMWLRGERWNALSRLLIVLLVASAPIAMWMLWSKSNFGDVTGSVTPQQLLGWTPKPFREWWAHPIFSWHGMSIFCGDLLSRFWRGELQWQRQDLHWPVADHIYAISSLLLLIAAIAGIVRNSNMSILPRQALALAALLVVASIAFLALLSIKFDFGACIYPSRDYPFFASGRLMSGALVPFALVYVYGLTHLLNALCKPQLSLLVLGAILLFATASEIAINRPVFASEHNWFHSL